jgi:hypothetical protein
MLLGGAQRLHRAACFSSRLLPNPRIRSLLAAARSIGFVMPFDREQFKDTVQVLALRIPLPKCNDYMRKFRG